MVIELNNGTQITLGPNDLKNIAFSDDNVVFTGNIIDELHNKMTELEASIAALQMMADQLRKQLEEKSSNDKVSALEAYMADMRPGWKA